MCWSFKQEERVWRHRFDHAQKVVRFIPSIDEFLKQVTWHVFGVLVIHFMGIGSWGGSQAIGTEIMILKW